MEALGLPEGTVAQRGEDGRVTIVNKPDAASAKAERDARLKAPRVEAARRRVDRLAQSIETIAGGMFDGGPIDQYALRYTPQGQEMIQASASLLSELTALTRVPGIGSQSDLETRLANLQLPSLEFGPEINRRAIEELRTFIADLSDAYASVGGQSESASAPTQPAQGGSTDINALLEKYR